MRILGRLFILGTGFGAGMGWANLGLVWRNSDTPTNKTIVENAQRARTSIGKIIRQIFHEDK